MTPYPVSEKQSICCGWVLPGVAFVLGFGLFFWCEPIFAAVDAVFHLYFSREYYEALTESLSWPDWDAFPYDGRGTAAFRFYAPLGYLVSAGWQVLGAPVHLALKLSIALFACIGAMGVGKWFGRIGLRPQRVWGMALFLSSPFLAVHLTRVFFYQNILAVLLVPWVFWGISFRGRYRLRGGVIAGIWLGLVALTHLPSALMAGYLCLALLVLTRRKSEPWMRILQELGLILVIAGGLVAPYAFPATGELDTINFHRHMEVQIPGKPGDFLDDTRFPSADQTLQDSAPWSSFFLGHGLHARFRLLLSLVLLLTLPVLLWRRTALFARFGVVGVVFLGLVFRASLPLWSIVPGLYSLQYSWRWVFPVSILLLPALACALSLPGRGRWLGRAGLMSWTVILLSIQWVALPLTQEGYSASLRGNFHYPCEYVPRSCSLADCRLSRPIPALGGEYHRFWGTASLTLQISESRRDFIRAHVSLATSTVITSQTHYDPHWEILDVTNRQSVPCQSFGPCGLLQFTLSDNCQEFTMSRTRGWRRNLGWVLFLVTTMGLGWFFRRETSADRNRRGVLPG